MNFYKDNLVERGLMHKNSTKINVFDINGKPLRQHLIDAKEKVATGSWFLTVEEAAAAKAALEVEPEKKRK
jgi:hypothetical protein